VYFDMLCLSARANRAYCRRHEIAYQAFVGVKRGFHSWQATYNRIPLLQELVDAGFAGWVLYLDADAYVADLDFDLRLYLADRHSMSKYTCGSLVCISSTSLVSASGAASFRPSARCRGRCISRSASRASRLRRAVGAAVPMPPRGSPPPSRRGVAALRWGRRWLSRSRFLRSRRGTATGRITFKRRREAGPDQAGGGPPPWISSTVMTIPGGAIAIGP
jgi:hypothetical protein